MASNTREDRLHPVSFIDYQFQRLLACGDADSAKLAKATSSIHRFEDLAAVLEQLSREAEAQCLLREATTYQRGCEFFTPAVSPARMQAYERFLTLFTLAYEGQGWVRHRIPYRGGALPAYALEARGERRGAVLLHGGFDSLIEEFIGVWVALAEAGFDVFAFEGPGQGGARLIEGLAFDHAWERPVAAVLDHFALDRADLVGISMGGWWALRAAAHESRIRRVVSWPPVYDWLHQLPPWVRPWVRRMVGFRGLMNLSIRMRMSLFPVLRHAVAHAMYLVDGDEPMDAVDWMLGMNAEALSSEKVCQDVLLMVGEHDVFQPPRLADAQMRALRNARSLTRRDFTAAENAASHCQMGNLGLACEVLTTWLKAGLTPGESRRCC